MISYGTPWHVERVAHESGLVVVSNWQGKPWNVVRLADGAVQSLPPGDAAAAEGAFQEQPRAQTVVTERSGPLALSRRAVVLAAIRGDQAMGLTPYERARIVTRAFELLGEDGGPALLRLFEGPQRNVADPERNVTRAAYWTLRSRDDGVELARAALADATRPVQLRIMCAWLVSQTVPISEVQPLRKAISDPDTRLSEAATWALADRRWEAGPEFLRLLRSGTGPQLVVAQFFETYIIEGSIPSLREALARSPKGSPLRESLSKALRTQGAGGEGR